MPCAAADNLLMTTSAQLSAGLRERLSQDGWTPLLLLGLGGYFLIFLRVARFTPDELWFLQVLARLDQGAVLYRDVFLGVPPLAAYVGRLGVMVGGVEVWTLRALIWCAVMLTLWLTLQAAQLLGASRSGVWLAVLVVAWYSTPAMLGLYQQLALLGMMGGLVSMLLWRQAEPGLLWRWTVLAGVVIGLTAATKHTIGALTGLAVAVAMVSARPGLAWQIRLRHLAMATMVSLTTFALIMLPVFGQNAWVPFLDYVIINKGTYMEVAAQSYLWGLVTFLVELPVLPWHRSLGLSILIWPPFCLLAWLASMWCAECGDRRTGWLVGAFALAGWLGAWPRFDLVHVQYAFAPCLLAGTFGLIVLRRRWEHRWSWQLAKWGMVVVCLTCFLVHVVLYGGGAKSRLVVLEQSPFRGVRAAPGQQKALRELTMANALPKESLFLATPWAGLIYLASGRENPTPYDYPVVAAFGVNGEQLLIRQLEQGSISAVVYGFAPEDPLAPADLYAFLHQYWVAEQIHLYGQHMLLFQPPSQMH